MLKSIKDLKHPVINLVTREEWGARPPRSPPEKLPIPVKMLQVYDTRTRDCYKMDECKKLVQDIQNDWMFYRGFDDIPWNFLVGADGNVYEGRGWKVKPIKTDLDHPRQKKWDGKSIDVAYIGDYRRKHPRIKIKVATTYICFSLDKRKHIKLGHCYMEDFTMTPEKVLVEET